MGKHYRPPGKKKEGNAAKYMTRSQAVKHLQVTLPLFRRLCILKGVFPREPKKKVKGNHHTYYHVKDIDYINHDPLLEEFRAIAAYNKKIRKAEAKKNGERASRLQSRMPTYKIDRLVKERYPRFVDALGDLDDCLTMVHLFAALPALEREKVEVQRIHKCRRLAHEWQAYVSRTHKLRKTFISVKGIYYQAEVEGQKIIWLTPHSLQQVLVDDIDFNVMLTFLEFYETLLAFVNFRLYHSINLKYPPMLDPRLEALAADLYALSRYIDANARKSLVDTQTSNVSESEPVEKGNVPDESELRLAQLQHQLPSNEPGALMHLVEDVSSEDDEDQDTKECKRLFRNMKFFVSREVPRESLLFIIPAFGGMVSWEGEGAPFEDSDQTITHQIVDRPVQGHMYFSREYVQPQWVFDCVNARIIIPTESYMVGRVPPPHLSPFVDNEAEGYVPDYAETIKRWQAAARNEVLPLPGVGKEDLEDPQNLLLEGISDRAQANEAAQRKEKMKILEQQYQDELKKEFQGVQYSSHSSVGEQTYGEVPEAEGETALNNQPSVVDLSDTALMSRKKRKLYEAMMISKERKRAQTDRLRQRKKDIEAQKSKS